MPRRSKLPGWAIALLACAPVGLIVLAAYLDYLYAPGRPAGFWDGLLFGLSAK